MTTLRYGVALSLLGGLLFGCGQQPSFRGTVLDPPRESRDFALQDQFGKRVRLSDLQGRVVVLTFLYTSCPDLCPLLTEKLRKTVESLGEQAPKAAILAVTVDPERDTTDRAHAYSQQHQMLDRWHFLTGEAKELPPIWEYYWVGKVQKDRKGEIMHQAPVHLIDRRGRIRVVYGSSFEPADLAHDVMSLLRH
jgi:protein SCO1/2